MSRIQFLIVFSILWVTGIANAQQQVSKNEARNAATNTLHNKEDVLKRASDTEIDTVYSFSNSRSNILTFINKERRKLQ
jgi:uncharacterized protein YggE